jgi:branched-chain amino acid transport system substrate-binding protein
MAASLAMFWAASVCAADGVPVGFVVPLTNSSADIGKQIKLGATLAADEINRTGGLSSLGGAPLKLIFADSETNPSIGYSETERLILREQVSVLCGAYNSQITFPAIKVAERYKTPWVVNSAAMDEITEQGFKYIFRPCNSALFDAKEQFDAIEHFSRETGKQPRTVGLVYQSTDWGHAQAKNIRRLAVERGYFLIVDKAHPDKQLDFSPILAQVRERNPDLLIVALYTDDHVRFSKAMMKERIDVPFGIHSIGAGSEDPLFYQSAPRASVDYMFVQEDWPADRSALREKILGLNQKFKDGLGSSINAYGAQGYSNVWLIHDALNRSGSTDREKIRNALAKTDITAGPALVTGYQRITFDPKGQNAHAHGVVSQNQKGDRTPLWPQDNRPPGAKPVWPVPSWDQR